MKYLAKSNPQETIQQHTDKLLNEYEILKRSYPSIPVNWELLKLACIYHDFGKMNRKFQSRIRGRAMGAEVPHGFLSVGFLKLQDLSKDYSKAEITNLVNAIAFHHERNFDKDSNKALIKEEIEDLKDYSKDFSYLSRDDYYKDLNYGILKIIKNNRIQKKSKFNIDNSKNYYEYILLKGLLNKIDYAASSGEEVEKVNDFLEYSLNSMLEVWKEEDSKADFNSLQYYMAKNREENLIVVAETGMGKTEAGLLWIGNNKGFFTLPLKTAINSIYDRIRYKIVIEDIENRVGLLHGDAISEYLERLDHEDGDVRAYNDRTRRLSLPLTVSTIDQIFDFVYKYGGFELKLASLSYSKIVIDEIQMYSSDLIAYLICGLKEDTDLGGKFAIVTATFPPFIGELLKDKGIDFKEREAFLNKDRLRHSIKLVDEEMDSEFIRSKYRDNKVLVIVNTVKKAQEIYQELKDLENVNLFHSRFIKKDRDKKEREILELGKVSNRNSGIWIATQVAEASLDIDFDILITELSDINGLFQRMGRCYRNRELDVDYNIYTFVSDGVTGVGKVIDKDLFEFSRDEIKSIDGPIRESKKIEIINNIYSKDRLLDTEYYRKIISTMEYIDGMISYRMTKEDAKKYFRNIKSQVVIPEIVYYENKEEIEKNIDIIKEKTNKDMDESERNLIRNKKIRARNEINKFSVSIPYYALKEENLREIKINKYEKLNIFACDYNNQLGIIYIEEKKKDRTQDNFFNW